MSDSLHVLHYVADSYPVVAGYTVRTHSIGRALVERGHRVSVARRLPVPDTPWPSHDVPDRAELDGVSYLSPPEGRIRYGIADAWALRLARAGLPGAGRVRRRIEARRYARWLAGQIAAPDVVHVHSPAELVAEGRLIAAETRSPLIYEVRGFWALSAAAEEAPDSDVDVERLIAPEITAARRADQVVAICNGIADRLLAAGIPPSKICVVPNGVSSRDFRPVPRDAELSRELGLDGKLVFGYATNVRKMEGLDVMARAWSHVLRAIPEATFVLVGDGTHLEALRGLVRSEGVESSFLLLGRVARERIAAYYSLFDVFVVPRIDAPVCRIVTPLKPLEAMAMGIPVLASDVGGLTELIRDGQTGALFRAGEPDSAAEHCIRLGRDESLREALGRNAREWVTEHRDWRTICVAYDALYDRLLSGN